jgi:hypothetical protein
LLSSLLRSLLEKRTTLSMGTSTSCLLVYNNFSCN